MKRVPKGGEKVDSQVKSGEVCILLKVKVKVKVTEGVGWNLNPRWKC
jgi:hypothetical protein